MKYYLIVDSKNIEIEMAENPINAINLGNRPIKILDKNLTKVIDYCYLVGNCTLFKLMGVTIVNGNIEFKDYKLWKVK